MRDVKKCETAKEIWDQLHNLRTLFDPWNFTFALQKFDRVEKLPDESMLSNFNTKYDLLEQLRDSGLQIDDVLGAIRIVNGLPPEYEVFIRNIKVFEKDFYLENLKISLLQEEAKIILGNSNKTAVESCAMVAQPKHVS